MGADILLYNKDGVLTTYRNKKTLTVDTPTAGVQKTFYLPEGVDTLTDNGRYDVRGTAEVAVAVRGGFLFTDLISDTLSTIYATDLAGVTEIRAHAFEECYSLTSVGLPDGLLAIWGSAFSSCPISSIVLPSTLETIDDYAFANTNLTEISFPAALQALGKGVFAGTRLQRLIIPEVVDTFLGDGFDGEAVARACAYLEYLDLPSTTSSITNGAFFFCMALRTIVCRAETPPYVDNTTFTWNQWTLPTNQVTIYVPATALADYRAADYWKNYNLQAIT